MPGRFISFFAMAYFNKRFKELPPTPSTEDSAVVPLKLASESPQARAPSSHHVASSHGRSHSPKVAHREMVHLRNEIDALQQALADRDLEIAMLRRSLAQKEWALDESDRHDAVFLRNVREALEARQAARDKVHEGLSVQSPAGTHNRCAAFSDSDSDYF